MASWVKWIHRRFEVQNSLYINSINKTQNNTATGPPKAFLLKQSSSIHLEIQKTPTAQFSSTLRKIHPRPYYYECPSYLFAFKRQNWNQNQIELQELYVKFSFELEAIIHLFIYTHGTDHFLAQSYYIYIKKGVFSWISILNRLLSVNVYAHSHAQEILGYTVLCIKLSIKRWCCGSSPLQHLFVFLAVSNMSIIQNICWKKVQTYTSHNNFLCLKSEYHLHWFKLF